MPHQMGVPFFTPSVLNWLSKLPPPPCAAGARWTKFAGQPGYTYTLLSEGDGTQVDSTFEAGGLGGKATFVRALSFTRAGARVTITLTRTTAGKWLLTGERVHGKGGSSACMHLRVGG